MTPLSPLLLALAVLALTLISPMLPANACSCVPPDAGEFLRTSDFVFVGSLTANPLEGGAFNDVSEAPYTFEVDAVYRGDIRDANIQIWSATSSAACGLEIAVGEPVGVAASFFDGRLSSGLCSVVGAEDLEGAAAEQGIEPNFPSQASDQPPGTDVPDAITPENGTSTVLAVGALAVLIAGVGWTIVTRRSS